MVMKTTGLELFRCRDGRHISGTVAAVVRRGVEVVPRRQAMVISGAGVVIQPDRKAA
jgi:hypothetical protein